MSDTKKKIDTDADYRKKSHAHKDKSKEDYVKICRSCKGACTEKVVDAEGRIWFLPCEECDGEGVVIGR